jgi:hypothetical protein
VGLGVAVGTGTEVGATHCPEIQLLGGRHEPPGFEGLQAVDVGGGFGVQHSKPPAQMPPIGVPQLLGLKQLAVQFGGTVGIGADVQQTPPLVHVPAICLKPLSAIQRLADIQLAVHVPTCAYVCCLRLR